MSPGWTLCIPVISFTALKRPTAFAAFAEYVQLYGGTIDESGRRFIVRDVA